MFAFSDSGSGDGGVGLYMRTCFGFRHLGRLSIDLGLECECHWKGQTCSFVSMNLPRAFLMLLRSYNRALKDACYVCTAIQFTSIQNQSFSNKKYFKMC